jgi:hypothetical protein
MIYHFGKVGFEPETTEVGSHSRNELVASQKETVIPTDVTHCWSKRDAPTHSAVQ